MSKSNTAVPYIQVELAIAWPDHTWDAGHYVYVPETVGDFGEAAKEQMEDRLAAHHQNFLFVSVYSWNAYERFTEDGEPWPTESSTKP